MKSRRLRWLTIIVPTAAIAVFDYVRHVYFPEPLHVWPGTILFLVVVALGAFLLSTLVFERFERYQERLWRTTRELSTLNAVAAVAGLRPGPPPPRPPAGEQHRQRPLP